MGKRVKGGAVNLNRAVAYIRVSTKEQHLGPEAQKAAIQAWAAQHGVEIASWHVDHGRSGSLPFGQRPGLLEAIQALPEHACGVLVATRRDRFGRDVGVVRELARHLALQGSRLVSVAGEGTGLEAERDLEDPDAALSSGISDVLAEHYRLLVKRRTKQALGVKKAKGERTGGIPYGFRVADDAKTLVEDQAEQAVLARITALSAAGVSMRGIVAVLDTEQVPPRGARWHLTSVARILRAAS